MNLLFDLQQEHETTLVLVTHDEILASRCKRSVRMIDGCLREVKGAGS
jgi:putative ABC transport system ATP-binding protein